MKKIYLLVILLCITTASAQHKLKKADKLFAAYAYVDAAKAYEEYLKDNSKPGIETIKKIADSYYNIKSYKKALKWYTKLNDLQGSSMSDRHFSRYIYMLRAEEHYTKSDELLKQRLSKKADKTLLQRFINQQKYLDSINNTPSLYFLANLPSNTKLADFGTAFYGNKIVYSSGKDSLKPGGKTYSWNGQPFLELYVADRDSVNGFFSNETKFARKDQIDYHNATVAFSADLATVYYSANTVKKSGMLKNAESGTNNLQILKGQVEDDRIVNSQKLPFSSINYSVSHPALTPDGEWLFFTSDMPGGYGETDIYMAQIQNDGSMGKPQNLGPVINTAGKEMFPFINGNTLYFSSDGHYGLGGLDIFESTITDDRAFLEPLNLGRPANSNLDDFAFIIDAENVYGYLSSNRKGGKGDDDIYYFSKKQLPCTYIVQGNVKHKQSNIAISNASVKVYDESGKEYSTVVTGEDGRYSVEVPCNTKIIIEAFKPGHTGDKKEITTALRPGGKRKVDFELTTYDDIVKTEDSIQKIAINPIYFDLDKYAIRPDAALELDKVVYALKNFPEMVIKIASHTDSRASDDYNSTLSQNRAQATYNYIIARGIAASRIESVKGYGETRLKNKCRNDVNCTEEEHQLNRRSEFIVINK